MIPSASVRVTVTVSFNKCYGRERLPSRILTAGSDRGRGRAGRGGLRGGPRPPPGLRLAHWHRG
jgi:hypothetical protein